MKRVRFDGLKDVDAVVEPARISEDSFDERLDSLKMEIEQTWKDNRAQWVLIALSLIVAFIALLMRG